MIDKIGAIVFFFLFPSFLRSSKQWKVLVVYIPLYVLGGDDVGGGLRVVCGDGQGIKFVVILYNWIKDERVRVAWQVC